MIRFKEYLSERFVSIGLNPKHEKFREKLRGQIHKIIQKSYANVEGGYGGQGSGSDAESKAIHKDISSADHIKASVRNGVVSAVSFYKKSHGRKSIATGVNTDHPRGKEDWTRIKQEDKRRHGWGEFSGRAEGALKKLGYPQVGSQHAERLTGKKVKILDKDRYSREIGGKEHSKTILGYPKD